MENTATHGVFGSVLTLVLTPTMTPRKKLKKFYVVVTGNTKHCHEVIMRKLKKFGAIPEKKLENSKVVIVFCPIVSRFESDIAAALSDVDELGANKPPTILVAMHHTYSPDYIVPSKREHNHLGESVPVVHCLFHETKGFLRCPFNKEAVKTIRKQIGLKKYSDRCSIS